MQWGEIHILFVSVGTDGVPFLAYYVVSVFKFSILFFFIFDGEIDSHLNSSYFKYTILFLCIIKALFG